MLSPSRQCSSTPVGFGQGFLSKEQCDNSGASPYSPDVAPALKGHRFCDANDLLKMRRKS